MIILFLIILFIRSMSITVESIDVENTSDPPAVMTLILKPIPIDKGSIMD